MHCTCILLQYVPLIILLLFGTGYKLKDQETKLLCVVGMRKMMKTGNRVCTLYLRKPARTSPNDKVRGQKN